MLDSEKALELSRRLTVMQDFPRFPEAVEAVAEDLILLTEQSPNPDIAEARARWLVTEMRQKWTSWGGTDQMIRLYKSRFDPPLPPSNTVQNYGEKPKVICSTCNDTGAFRPGGRTSKDPFIWCDCEAGIHLHFDFPDWLNILNGKPTESFTEPSPEAQIARDFVHPLTEREIGQDMNPECPACQKKARHTQEQRQQFHPDAGHGYVKEAGWSKPGMEFEKPKQENQTK